MHETYLLSLIVSDFVCHMCDGGDDNKVGYCVILLCVSFSLFVIVSVYMFLHFGVFLFVLFVCFHLYSCMFHVLFF